MKKVVNMAHPLSQRAIEQIAAAVGDEVEIIDIPVQIDLDGDIVAQLNEFVDRVAAEVIPIDIMFPPSLPVAAAYVTARLSYAQSDAMRPVPPTLGWLRRSGPLGNEWELGIVTAGDERRLICYTCGEFDCVRPGDSV